MPITKRKTAKKPTKPAPDSSYGVIRIVGPPAETEEINRALKDSADSAGISTSEVALHILHQWRKGALKVPPIKRELRV
jgi:hypothetical protein